MSKYTRRLEEKGLIRTEPTMVRSKGGRPLNGNLLYTICPIQAAIELFYEQSIEETLTYCDFPTEHWTCIRTKMSLRS